MAWGFGKRAGVVFETGQATVQASDGKPIQARSAQETGSELIRNELLGLRAALDEVKFGVVSRILITSPGGGHETCRRKSWLRRAGRSVTTRNNALNPTASQR